MKLIKKQYMLAGAAALLLTATSCKKLADYNNNVNATTKAPASALLTNVESSIGGYAFSTTPGYYCQYFSQTQYTSESTYSLPTYSFSSVYSSYLMDLQDIINNSGNNNMNQVAKILQSYFFWYITDCVGDVPYSTALKGGNGNNAYDTQEAIYKGMIESLKAASAAFDNTTVITGDVIYSGTTASWKRTANSMRMLMALRLSKRYPNASDYAATEFAAAMNDAAGYISTNDQNFKVVYPGTAGFKNPIWNGYNGRKDNGESTTMTNLLSSLNDGRLDPFGGYTEATSTSDPANWNKTSSLGFPYGLTQNDASTFQGNNATWARILRGDLRVESSPIYLITASQIYLAMAEAADRGWISASGLNTYYTTGITLSYQQWGLSAPAASYFTQSGVALSAAAGTAANLKNIATQRYLATYPDGMQGWNEWRRTGYPVLTPAPAASNTGGQIPRRYVYGTTEYSSNPDNTKAAAALIPGGDTQDSRIWWDRD